MNLFLLVFLLFNSSAQTLKGLQTKLLALQAKADKKFKDYEIAFTMLGKRLFAVEENLSKSLKTIDEQQEKIDKLIHAQLLCGCSNDYNTENFHGKRHHVGVNLLLDLLLEGNNFSKTKKSVSTPTTTMKTTTTKKTSTTRKTTTRTTTTTTKRTSTTKRMTTSQSIPTNPPQNLGGFDIAEEVTTASTSDYETDDSGEEDNEAKCIEKANINAFVMSKWKNTQENLYQFNGDVIAQLPSTLPPFSILMIKFDPPLVEIETWDADATPVDREGQYWAFAPKYRDKYETFAGKEWKFNFMGKLEQDAEPKSAGFFCDKYPLHGQFGEPDPDQSTIAEFSQQFTRKKYNPTLCSAAVSGKPPSNPKNTEPKWLEASEGEKNLTKGYELNEVLTKSILFYEAQRAGPLGDENRIPWRGHSTLKDGCGVKANLEGGWFDAGDHVKFALPAAFTATLLAWGILDYHPAYTAAGELENVVYSIKWKLDWLMAAHPSPNVFYAQVGDGDLDHSYWGTPENMKMKRPVYKLTTKNPGTEPTAEAAAAMAAGSIIFREIDAEYSTALLGHAMELFAFADRYRKEYHYSIPEVAKFYKSWSGYNDELCWAAGWLYRASEIEYFSETARGYYKSLKCNYASSSISWDDKSLLVHLHMAQLFPEDESYRKNVAREADALIIKHNKTPKGLLFNPEISKWGSLRYASNWAYFLLGAARLEPKLPNHREYYELAIAQLGYALGDTGRSFVVGFGKDPPKQPHHRSSSCTPGEDCSSMGNDASRPNHFTLYGALVGGPNGNDQYADARSDYIANEVAIDYNAGFQGAIAGWKCFAMKEKCWNF